MATSLNIKALAKAMNMLLTALGALAVVHQKHKFANG